ncbi:MAG TPA: AI-2E family transporter YdiK [Nitrospirota bacterium]|nr:AI-2E family transporter YdiK [Nitrospirota bacterium]
MRAKFPIPRDITHTTLSVLFIGVLIAASFWIIRPFVISIIWAAVIVIATWPILERLEAMVAKKRGLAVAIMTAAILLIVLVPVTLAVLTIVNNAENITARVKSLVSFNLSSPPQWLERIPLKGEKLATQWREFAALSPEERSSLVTPYAQTAMQWFVAKVGSFGMTMLSFLLTTIIAAIMYAKGEVIRSGVRSFARRLGGPRGEDVAVLAAKAVRGVALGIVLTAIIQTALGGAGLFITGVPAATLLTAVMFMLCLAQIGPALVLVPAVIWLYWQDSALWGTILLIFTILALVIDNVVRPVLIKKGADLPLLLVFAGVIGGLIAFGVIGLFIGPVVLAVTYTLLKAWVTGSAQDEEEIAESE